MVSVIGYLCLCLHGKDEMHIAVCSLPYHYGNLRAIWDHIVLSCKKMHLNPQHKLKFFGKN